MNLFYAPYAECERARRLSPQVFAAVCRLNALYMIQQAGSGHVGSSFSSLDVVSWLYLRELRKDRDVYFSSKGHDAPGLYAALIGLGLLEFDLIHSLRRLGGLPGHPDVGTPAIPANTGSLGMGLSKAKGMIRASRLDGADMRAFVMTGDGELQEGQFWEAALSAASQKMEELTVIVDLNRLQSDTWVADVSDLGDLEQKFRSFGWFAARADGHDFRALSDAFSALGAVRGAPKVLIAETVKGKGVSFMERGPEGRLYRYHSGALAEADYSRALEELRGRADALFTEAGERGLSLETRSASAPPRPQGQNLVAAYAKALAEEGEKNPRLVVFDADLALDCGLLEFEKRFPERLIECGIAEQDMVSQAGALARRGFIPVVHSFAAFLSARANEQIANNASERSKVVYVGSLAGLLPGGPGHSHQAVRDVSALGAIPGLIGVAPCDERETRLAFQWAVREHAESAYLRLSSVTWPVPYALPAGYRFERGKGCVLSEGRDAVLFAYGPVLLSESFRAAEILRREGIGLRVVNLPWLNEVDTDWLVETAAGFERVVTVDDHYVAGGQGRMLAARLAQDGFSARVLSLGVISLPLCGRNDEVLKAHGLDASSIALRVLDSLGVARKETEARHAGRP